MSMLDYVTLERDGMPKEHCHNKYITKDLTLTGSYYKITDKIEQTRVSEWFGGDDDRLISCIEEDWEISIYNSQVEYLIHLNYDKVIRIKLIIKGE